jgi:outer membrane protein OmpA-like peptidoglycan-associated protein
MQRRPTQPILILAAILAGIVAITSAAFAEEHLRGVITGRATDGALIVRTDASEMTVVLNEATKIRLRSGVRVTKVDVPSLVPGLRVDVVGQLESTTRFAADRITYTREDLKTARDIAAGVTPTDHAVAANRSLIDAHQEQNAQRFSQQQQTLEQQARRIAANDEKIVATSGAVEATNGRIANLDDYTVVDTLTVYFRNGRSEISRDFQARLQQFAQKAKTADGYRVQVEGYASAVGQDTLNQMLSKQRAEVVAAALQQNGVPSTRMLVPAAMGTTDQIASNKTKDGQAQNRRTVIRLLQNRGITGN